MCILIAKEPHDCREDSSSDNLPNKVVRAHTIHEHSCKAGHLYIFNPNAAQCGVGMA